MNKTWTGSKVQLVKMPELIEQEPISLKEVETIGFHLAY